MPAINPTQLKLRSAQVSESFSHPEQYISALHEMLSSYANRVHRPGQRGDPPPGIDSYQASPPVLRYLERGVRQRLHESPKEGLILIDALWNEEWLETRLLAAVYLQYIPSSFKGEVLERVKTWAFNCEEDPILASLLDRGLSRLREARDEMYFVFLDELSSMVSPEVGKLVLFTLKPLAADDQFQNLPVIFQYLKPLIQNENDSYLSSLAELVKTLAQRSEQETLYFLQHQIPIAPKPKMTRLVRKSLDAFAPPSQKILKEAVK
ncbi:MAG: DNA alkylation repair protein [Anaerolineales bacterium]